MSQSQSQPETPRPPVDAVKVTVTFHHNLFNGAALFGAHTEEAMPPKYVECFVKESNLISEIKLVALEELGFNTTVQRKDGEWILRIQDFVLDDTNTLQGVMRDVLGHATVEALLARVGTIPMRLEFRKKEILIATH